MEELISGVQQIGIGVPDADVAFKWYRAAFGLDVPLFADKAEAKLMIPYTSGEVRSRYAILALNMAGGGGAEIWQYTKRVPQKPAFEPELGDLGLFAAKIKSRDVAKLHSQLIDYKPSAIIKTPENAPSFWINDLYGNPLQVVSDTSWFRPKGLGGGVLGAVIGVSNIENSLKLYANILGINEIIYDKTGTFDDFPPNKKFRRVLIRKTSGKQGAFSRLIGNVEIELVQALEGRTPRRIFEGRDWGDAGFIHLCFDTLDMEGLKQKCEKNGFNFTVDSANSFDMGDAAGRFAYIEDPDGALIEFVETHKVPVLKKLGIYLNIQKRGNKKPLPNWMVGMLGLGRVKD